jgi:hypothetical protein
MRSRQLPAQLFHEGSPRADTPLAGDTDETRGRIDTAPDPRAAGKRPARRLPTLAWEDLCKPAKAREAYSGSPLPEQVPWCRCEPPADPLQSPQPPASAALPDCSSHTHTHSHRSQSPGLQRDDGSVDGNQSGGELGETLQGHPRRTAEDVLVAQPVGPPPLSATIEKLCAIDVVEDYERYKRGYC